jgi:predicted dehydrogenase
VDVARWGLRVDAPLAVSSGGGKYLFEDDQEVPDTQIVTWEFPTACLVWEHRMWSSHPMEGAGFGIAFYGDKGTLVIGQKDWRIEDGGEKTPLGHSGEEGQAGPARPQLPRLRQEPLSPQRGDRDRTS